MKSKIHRIKNKALLSLAIAPMLLLVMAFSNKTAVKFAQAEWETSKTKALSEGKLYFVDFDASYCATCRNMDESTYMDTRLADYINQNVVALRVDVQDFDGVMWSQQYDVEALPTMLIFDAKGKLVKRLVGYKSADDLIKEFNLAKYSSVPSPAPTDPIITPQPIAADKPMINPHSTFSASTTNTTTAPKAVNTPTPTRGTTASSSGSFQADDFAEAPQPTGSGLYEIAVSKQSSKGFGVQVGVFSTYEGVLEEASKFKRKYTKKTVIHIDEYNGSTVYKLLLGVFDSRREAAFFRNDLRRDNTDGLIKDLRRMQ
jgi:thioredoxin-related protein